MSGRTPLEMVTGCIDENPPRSSAQMISDQSAGLAALVSAAGIGACTTAQGAGGSLLPPYGIVAGISIGCEQVAAMSSALDSVQRIFNCSILNLSQSTTTTAKVDLTITNEIDGSFEARNCEMKASQASGMKVAVYGQLDNDVKNIMNSTMKASIDGFLKNVQDEENKGLFATSQGQKSFQVVKESIQNYANSTAITTVVQDSFVAFSQSGAITQRIGPQAVVRIINENPNGPPYPQCFSTTQDFTMQVISQSIVTNALSNIFTTDVQAAMKLILENSQARSSDTGFGLPGFGSFLIILLIIIIVLPLIFGKKDNKESGQKEPILSGPAGKGLGIALMVIGFGLVIAGIVMLIIANKIVGGILLGGGAILAIIGIVLFVKARSQQTIYEQNLAIAKAASGGGGGGQNLAAQLIEKQ